MAAKKQRVHILSTVNAAAVSKTGGRYMVRDVCGAVDDIVMNGMAYPGDQLAAGVATLEGRPAPAGHPKNASGQYISATNGDALLSAYAGAICRNARHTGGRTLVDIEVDEAQARANADGAKLVERLDAAINGTNAEPIHVSTGLLCQPVTANGESRGKKYTRIATNIQYDHLAFLLNEQGAGKPEDGVGMFLNADGGEVPVEAVVVNTEPEDRRTAGLLSWIRRLVGNDSSDMSFDQITQKLYEALPKGAWLREVYTRAVIYVDEPSGKLYRQDYSLTSDGSVAFAGTAVEVTRKVEYEPVANHQEHDALKPQILAALNAAGVKTEGLGDDALLAAYNQLIRQPVEAQLTAANAKVAGFEQAAQAVANAERDTLAADLVANTAGGTLTVDDYKAMPVEVLRKLKANAKAAAPVVPGATRQQGADEFASYDLNADHTTA